MATLLVYKQRKKIEDCLKKNLSLKQISEKTGISKNTLYYEIRKNSIDNVYLAEKAQEKSELAKQERCKKLHKKNRLPPHHYRNKIKQLEDDVEFLKQVINEILMIIKR